MTSLQSEFYVLMPKIASCALQSAVEQTWKNTEILIVDDASTDKSVSIVQDYIAQYPHARLIKHDKNRGAAGARQTIVTHAQGDFIAFFDDDDESLPERIQKQYELIISYEEEAGESLIACYASGKRLYPNGYEIDIKAIGSEPQIPFGKDVADRLFFTERILSSFLARALQHVL